MRPPGIPWIGYNLLRLTAVIFICWALAAQFIAIANDILIYSQAPLTPSGAIANGSIDKTVSSSSSGQQSTIIGVQAPSTRTRNPYAAPTKTAATTSVSIPTSAAANAPIGAVNPSDAQAISPSIEEDDEGNVPGRSSAGVGVDVGMSSSSSMRRMRKREGEAEEVGEANWGLSSIPRQAGVVRFTVLSRLIMGFALALLLLGQIGWPEMFLYQWVPWLGPQSTPIWLGLVQSIIAVENLRVYASQVILLPSWGLFAIGLVNLLLGAVLLYLGRNLPKTPPPPLYFNHSTRLLYFTRPPACYNRILRKISAPQNVKKNGEELEVELPPSNVKTIGLDEDELEAHEAPEDHKKAARYDEEKRVGQPQPPSSRGLVHTDVRQGGYPTFSGGGLTDPGRQVPIGYLEKGKDGRLTKIIREDGTETNAPPPPLSAVEPSKGTSTLQAGKGGNGKTAPPSAWAAFKGTSADSSKDKHKHKNRKEVEVSKKDLPPRGQSRGQTIPLTGAEGQPEGREARAASAEPRRSSHEQSIRETIARDKALMEQASAKLRRADSVDTIALISRGKFPTTSTSDEMQPVESTLTSDTKGGKEGRLSRSSSRSRVPVPELNGRSESPKRKEKPNEKDKEKEGKDVMGSAKQARRTKSTAIPASSESANAASPFTDPELDATRRVRMAPWTIQGGHAQGQERQSSYSTISATEDLGPRFPLPPDRQGGLDDLAEGEEGKSQLARSSSKTEKEDNSFRQAEDGTSVSLVSLSRAGSLRGPVPPKRTNSRKKQADESVSATSAAVLEDVKRSDSKRERLDQEDALAVRKSTKLRNREDRLPKSSKLNLSLDAGRPYQAQTQSIDGEKEPSSARSSKSKVKSKTPKSPKTPRTPRSANQRLSTIAHTPSTASSRSSSLFSRLSGSGSASGFRMPQRKRAATMNIDTNPTRERGKLKPTLTTGLGRSVSTRTARGVRFDLSPSPTNSSAKRLSQAEQLDDWEDDELNDKGDRGSDESKPSLGIRIPGTNLHLPFSLPSTPRSATTTTQPAASKSKSKKTESMNTFDSTLSSEFDLELGDDSQSEAPSSASTDVRGKTVRPRIAQRVSPDDVRGAAVAVRVQPKIEVKKSRTMHVLGGGYLDGGKEHI
ncbi:hypothetical protein IAT40_005514 [Kwoniella sp. CBS 6097]